MPITQKQLAEYAGVSIVTVFNALYKPEKVKAETRKKIFDLMEEYDYTPDAVARSMVKQKTNIIGVIIPSFEVPYYARLVSIIERKLNALGFRALISQHLNDHRKEVQEIQLMREYRVEGMILRDCNLERDIDELGRLVRTNIPFVMLDNDSFHDRFVGDDDIEGSFALVSRLISSGRRKIACIGFHRSGNIQNSNRYLGYCRAHELHGLQTDPRLQISCEREFHSGAKEIDEILRRTADDPQPIDAVFASNDNIALSIIKQLCKRGFSLQKDILVSGYGGYFEELPFSLPTVQQDLEQIGILAVEKLIHEIRNPDAVRKSILIKGNIRMEQLL